MRAGKCIVSPPTHLRVSHAPVTVVAFEGEDQGMRLWRILASRGIVKARNAQARPFSLFSVSSVTVDHLAAANDRFRFGLQ
jgi:hypothetical protein